MLPQNDFDDIELHPRETNGCPSTVPAKRKVNLAVRFADSFKRRERAISSLEDTSNPVEGDTSPLNRSLKGRHLQFIAIGGSIGAGLFIGCGKALAIGGPAWLLIAFSIVGVMLLCVMHALGELAAVYPISGINNPRFRVNGRVFRCLFGLGLYDKSWGFAMGWNYAMQWLAVLPFVFLTSFQS